MIRLFRSSDVGFDLDTRRPLFASASAASAFIMQQTPAYSFDSSNFNKIGDDMLLPGGFETVAECDIGIFRFGNSGRIFWFRIRDVYVNETNRTRVVYDIDFMLSFIGTFTRGHVLCVPKGNKYALPRPVSPRFWKYVNSAPIRQGIRVAVVLKQMKTNTSGSYDVNGPVYMIIEGQWFAYQSGVMTMLNLLKQVSDLGHFALTDVVNAWIIPSIGSLTIGNLQYWNSLSVPAQRPGVSAVKWTNSTGFASWDVTTSVQILPDDMKITEGGETFMKSTDTAEGRLMGICDERGNILFTFPDKVKVKNSFYVGFRMSMASCEVDIVLNGSDNGFISGHTKNHMFTYSCRPLDVIGDSWQDYLFRQRDADIQNRKIQNESALAGAGATAVTGAMTGAMLGSVVPGIGTAAGAIAGGIAGLATSAVQYGIQSYYGERQQEVTDKIFQLAQDTVAVNGMITSYSIALQNTLYCFLLEVDDQTKAELDAANAIEGVPADGFTLTLSQDMADAMNADSFLPWACTAECPVPIPASWKKAISEQMAAGATYKKFGAW